MCDLTHLCVCVCGVTRYSDDDAAGAVTYIYV